MNNLHYFENRMKTIKAHFQHDFTGYQNRGQITKESNVHEASTYGPLGVAHAKELSQTVEKLRACIPNNIHILDIGCGYALSRAVLKDSGIFYKSYRGFDTNESMLWFAKQIDKDGEFLGSLDQLPIFNEHVLVIINHVFGQDSVSLSDLTDWVTALTGSCKDGFTLLSIEIDGYAPAMRNFTQFRKILDSTKFGVRNEIEYRIKGQHKNEKVIRQWKF
jgi:SAM-dependent methyltransferase